MIKMHYIICFQFAHIFIICIFYEVAKQWNIFHSQHAWVFNSQNSAKIFQSD